MLYSRNRWIGMMHDRTKNLIEEERSRIQTEETRYIDSLEKVLQWCEKKKLSVDWIGRGGGSYDFAEKQITVSSRSLPRIQLFVLLHECGHYLIGKPKAGGRWSAGYSTVDIFSYKSDLYKIDVLDEEFEAWGRGWDLGLKLGAVTAADRYSFNKYRVSMLKGYIKWVLEN